MHNVIKGRATEKGKPKELKIIAHMSKQSGRRARAYQERMPHRDGFFQKVKGSSQ